MKIEIVTAKNEYNQDNRFSLYMDSQYKFTIGELCDCPEDATLWRDLNFVYSIPGLLQKAYNAGQRGEDFKILYSGEE